MNSRRYPLASLSQRRLRRLRTIERNAALENNAAAGGNIFPEVQNHLADIYPADTVMEDDTMHMFEVNNETESGAETAAETEISEMDMSETDVPEADDEEADADFLQKISQWATEGISIRKVNEILNILRGHQCFAYLPADSRTLLKTPRTMDVQNIGGGSYCHIGIEKGLTQLINVNPSLIETDTIRLQCSFDGLQLTKSTNSQLWPILMCLTDFPSIPPFVVGIYHGNEKPTSCSEYLAIYVEEMRKLKTDGLQHNGMVISVIVTCYVCDAPARAFVAQIKSHTGYFGCGKCTIQGEYINNRVTFGEVDAALRTNESFSLMVDEDHHVGRSPLLEIPETQMVSRFAYEYMHLVCLGVMRKLLLAWMKGSLNVRMQARKINLLNERIVGIAKLMPLEFARKPRVMQEVMRWKATEFRMFLVYTGPYLLEGILSSSLFKHFLALHYAIRILLSSDLVNLDYGRTLLKYFVKKYEVLYGRESMTYNVHGLLHLADDCRVHGSLDRFSAFKFESKLYQIKRLVRNPNLPLPQIVRQLHEQSFFPQRVHAMQREILRENKVSHRTLPFDLEGPGYSHYPLNNATVSDKAPNNCVVMKSGEIVVVGIISSRNGKIYVVGKPFENTSSFYERPAPSYNTGIHLASNLLDDKLWAFTDIRGKAILFSLS
ncbi:hypothetical protein J437_LFUL011595 [Ladona fulva]|uniref:Transposase domain-containing protein n=1 Tax=Ladona fulva TaxID=123851 RepID=A0A8K0KUF3_LADFU|nr:hypothetical protein J437_LFUL011595 [Ladona fulva]